MRVPLRSFLFVPGDSERKLEKALSTAADALVLDLEDSIAPGHKHTARDMVAQFLRSGKARLGLELWVRINPLTTEHALADLAAIIGGRPSGLLLPKTEGPEDIRRLSNYLDALEIREGIAPGSTELIAVATETAAATFSLGSYTEAGLDRLYGMTWGAEDLSADIGAASNQDSEGQLSLTYRMVRSNLLLGAKAAGIHALETAYPDFRNIDVFHKIISEARREGFMGGFAIHPAQVEPLNQAFTPDAVDIALAERVVTAFAESPDVGAVGIDGKMYDRPHLIQARKVLAMRDAFVEKSA